MSKNRGEFSRRADTRFLFFLSSRSHGCKKESVRCITTLAAVVLIPIKLFGSDANLAVGRLPYDHDRSSFSLLFLSTLPVRIFIHTLYLLLHFMPLLSTPHVSLPRNRNVLIRRTNGRQWWFHFFRLTYFESLQILDPANRTTLYVHHPPNLPSLNVDRVENDPRLRFGSRSGKMIRQLFGIFRARSSLRIYV